MTSEHWLRTTDHNGILVRGLRQSVHTRQSETSKHVRGSGRSRVTCELRQSSDAPATATHCDVKFLAGERSRTQRIVRRDMAAAATLSHHM